MCYLQLSLTQHDPELLHTPTTVANAAPDCKPKSDMATATDNSKKLLAPIIPAGAAIL